mgnify:CR=1 FL=1
MESKNFKNKNLRRRQNIYFLLILFNLSLQTENAQSRLLVVNVEPARKNMCLYIVGQYQEFNLQLLYRNMAEKKKNDKKQIEKTN